MENQNLDYVLCFVARKYGPMGVSLWDNGKHLEFVRVIEDESVYGLMGEKVPPKLEVPKNMEERLINAGNDWKILMHGREQSISDVVEKLYSQKVDAEEEMNSTPNFYSRNRFKAGAATAASALVILLAGGITAELGNKHGALIYSAVGLIEAGILIAGIMYIRRYWREDKKIESARKNVISSNIELDALREAIIRAGVLQRVFPESYGLPK